MRSCSDYIFSVSMFLSFGMHSVTVLSHTKHSQSLSDSEMLTRTHNTRFIVTLGRRDEGAQCNRNFLPSFRNVLLIPSIVVIFVPSSVVSRAWSWSCTLPLPFNSLAHLILSIHIPSPPLAQHPHHLFRIKNPTSSFCILMDVKIHFIVLPTQRHTFNCTERV